MDPIPFGRHFAADHPMIVQEPEDAQTPQPGDTELGGRGPVWEGDSDYNMVLLD